MTCIEIGQYADISRKYFKKPNEINTLVDGMFCA